MPRTKSDLGVSPQTPNISTPEAAATHAATPTPATAMVLDVSECAREQIQSPATVQPHGALIAALADSLLVTHASANLLDILGRSAQSVLGRPLEDAIGEATLSVLRGIGASDGSATGKLCTLPTPGGGILLHAHMSGRHICVDIEPVQPETVRQPPITMLQAVLESFKQATSPGDLCNLAVRGLQEITGYDRVMAYRFDSDGNGEVIAEIHARGLPSYLGLQYPAADIPPQSRRLFISNRVFSAADFNAQQAPLLSDPALDDGTPLDLTHSALRGVSPVHCQYMRNMNNAASLTIALAHTGTLWGLVVCHHQTPRIAGPELRAVVDMIAQVVSLLLRSLGEAAAYAERLERNAALVSLVDRLTAAAALHGEIASAEAALLHLVNATGVLVSIGGNNLHLGRLPPLAAAEHALAILRAEAGGKLLAVSDLGLSHPELADCTANGSGALLLPLSQGTDDAILWFRPELPRTVVWAGNPAEHVTADAATGRLSPRASFAAWKQLVSGRSTEWTRADLVLATELGGLVEAAVALRAKSDLARLRHYDALTGLPNRSLLQERLQESERHSDPDLALLFLDLDRFKAVNDTMGHPAGDALLIEVARRLLASAGPENLVARLGGDEFVVLCRGMAHDAVAELGEKIRQAIEAPFEIAERSCHISVSIGIAAAGRTGGIDLVRAADMAMYAAKKDGGNRGTAFDPSLFDRAAQEFQLEADMHAALSSGDEFVLLYQPLFDIGAGAKRLVGFEALARWRHPRHGWMSPSVFIPLAEKSGMILPLGDWVLAAALRQGRAFRLAHPGADLKMSVNLSVLQLPRAGFCADLAGVLEAEGYPAEALCLEVTESVLTNDVATSVLADIRKLGVRIAIDDFGVGYSSLSYLRRIPADVIKLDRSFLDGVEGDPMGVAFVTAVVALAHATGKPVVFEGIETQSQFDIVLASRADMVQGFFFAPPLSANAAADLVGQYRRLDDKQSTKTPFKGEAV